MQEQEQDVIRQSQRTPPNQAASSPVSGKEERRYDDPDRIHEARILIVDDHEETATTIEYILRRSGYRSVEITLDSRETFPLLARVRADLMILGLCMPPPDGLAILDQLALLPVPDRNVPVLMVAAEVTHGGRIKALSKGARGLLQRPVDFVDLLTHARNLVEWRFLTTDLQTEQCRWRIAPVRSADVTEQDLDLTAETFEQLRRIHDYLDPGHVPQAERTAEIAYVIGAEMGLAQESLRHLAMAARVFDFGMLAVPDAIRTCERKLTPAELKAMHRHTVAASEMFGGSRIPGTQLLQDVAAGHHERWDGTGYPRGLKGPEIPLAGRIVGVAQYYCALIADRPHRPAREPMVALEEVSRQRGYAFDPEVVDALRKALQAPFTQSDPVAAA